MLLQEAINGHHMDMKSTRNGCKGLPLLAQAQNLLLMSGQFGVGVLLPLAMSQMDTFGTFARQRLLGAL